MKSTLKKKQSVLIATYGDKPKSMRLLSRSISNQERNWSPVFLPSNPSAIHLGEIANQHNVQTFALYLETPQQLTLLQHEIQLLQRLTHNNAQIIVGGSAHTLNGRLHPAPSSLPSDKIDKFVAMLDEQLDTSDVDD